MTISCEPVPRMPRTRQVFSTLTPPPLSGSGKCRTVGPLSGLSHTALVTSTSPTGTPLAKILRAVMRQPPSTRSALPDPAIQSEPPLLTRTRLFEATLRNRGSSGMRGRTAIACEDPQHLAELSVVGAAAEHGREAGTQYAMLLQ